MQEFNEFQVGNKRLRKRKIILLDDIVIIYKSELTDTERRSLKQKLKCISQRKPLSSNVHKKISGYNVWQVRETNHRFFYKKADNGECVFCAYEYKNGDLPNSAYEHAENKCNKYIQNYKEVINE